MYVYIVQGNPRDFGGRIELITVDEQKALKKCCEMTVKHNSDSDYGPDATVAQLREELDDLDFYDRVCTSAWVSGFFSSSSSFNVFIDSSP